MQMTKKHSLLVWVTINPRTFQNLWDIRTNPVPFSTYASRSQKTTSNFVYYPPISVPLTKVSVTMMKPRSVSQAN